MMNKKSFIDQIKWEAYKLAILNNVYSPSTNYFKFKQLVNSQVMCIDYIRCSETL